MCKNVHLKTLDWDNIFEKMHIRKHFLEKTIDAETRQMEANKMLLKCARKIRCDKMFQNVFFLQTP